MADLTGVVALVIAAVALVVAAAQLTQQLLATGYVLRKCDRLVTGGLVKGGRREWRWRQFRFTVNYQAIVFALPDSVYASLGVTPTVHVSEVPGTDKAARAMNKACATLHERAKECFKNNRRVSEQACWILMVQDLAATDSLLLNSYCLRQESGDRIPDDLTVAPIRVDALTILLTGLAMEMQVYRYSPTLGEVSLAGPLGSISSSVHPLLGGLMHYSAFREGAGDSTNVGNHNGVALCGKGGIWANAVFGRFRDRSLRDEFVPLGQQQVRHMDILRKFQWPENSFCDTIGGAACFLSFAHVDVYHSGAPSVIRRWCAHFGEFIVAIHHMDIIQSGIRKQDDVLDLSHELILSRRRCVELNGFSSPHVDWTAKASYIGVSDLDPRPFFDHVGSPKLIIPSSLVDCLQIQFPAGVYTPGSPSATDPSVYVPSHVAWEVIILADQCLSYIKSVHPEVVPLAYLSTARAVCSLSEVGPPSWGTAVYQETVSKWPKAIDQACSEHMETSNMLFQLFRSYTELSLLRAAYFTIMMRGAHNIGSGLTESSTIETALLYMA